jgi:hypothetical protein
VTPIYLRNHTEFTRVSCAPYREAIAAEERMFGGILAVFFLLAVVINAPARSGSECAVQSFGRQDQNRLV